MFLSSDKYVELSASSVRVFDKSSTSPWFAYSEDTERFTCLDGIDESLFVVGCKTGKVLVFSANKLESSFEVPPVTGSNASIFSVKLVPIGEKTFEVLVVHGNSREVVFYSLQGQFLRSFKEPSKIECLGVARRFNESNIYAVGLFNQVKLYQIGTWKFLKSLKGFRETPKQIEISSVIVVSDGTNSIYKYQSDKKTILATVTGNPVKMVTVTESIIAILTTNNSIEILKESSEAEIQDEKSTNIACIHIDKNSQKVFRALDFGHSIKITSEYSPAGVATPSATVSDSASPQPPSNKKNKIDAIPDSYAMEIVSDSIAPEITDKISSLASSAAAADAAAQKSLVSWEVIIETALLSKDMKTLQEVVARPLKSALISTCKQISVKFLPEFVDFLVSTFESSPSGRLPLVSLWVSELLKYQFPALVSMPSVRQKLAVIHAGIKQRTKNFQDLVNLQGKLYCALEQVKLKPLNASEDSSQVLIKWTDDMDD
jgi:Dip2/Utp12 Family